MMLAASMTCCAQSNKSVFVGKWLLGDGTTVTFKKDGTFVSSQKVKQESKGMTFNIIFNTPGKWEEKGDSITLAQDAKGIKVSMSFADTNSVDTNTMQSYEAAFGKMSEDIQKSARQKDLPPVTYAIKKIEKEYFEIFNPETQTSTFGSKK